MYKEKNNSSALKFIARILRERLPGWEQSFPAFQAGFWP